MNTDEYIEKYSTIKKTKQEILVTMKVPPRRIANVQSEISEDSIKRKVTAADISEFLLNSGHKNLVCMTTSFTIDNCHDRGLEKTWIFKVSAPARKKTKSKITNEK
tara:strand:+ start:439 stop:756 length:318 start_codon:yes stop_codon:yes gene_type:complete